MNFLLINSRFQRTEDSLEGIPLLVPTTWVIPPKKVSLTKVLLKAQRQRTTDPPKRRTQKKPQGSTSITPEAARILQLFLQKAGT